MSGEEKISRGDAEARSMNMGTITGAIIDEAIKLHRDLGPGLLESVYEAVLGKMLVGRGLSVERQKKVVFEYAGIRLVPCGHSQRLRVSA